MRHSPAVQLHSASPADDLVACERRYRSVFDSGCRYAMLLDADGRVLDMNRAARRAFPGADAMLGQANAWECLWWNTRPLAGGRLRAAVEQVGVQAPVVYDDEFLTTEDEADPPLVLEITVSRMPGTGEFADQIVVEARDVSRRRRSRLANHEIDTLTAVGHIAAKVAHEINNPLAGIHYAFLLIKDAIPPSHPNHKYVGAIEREIVRIAAVTRQLYETYRPEPEARSVTSLTNLVGDAISFMQQVNRNSGVRIVADLTGVPALVPVSGAVLRQVVYNLVQNALDASPEGSTVSVTASMVDQLEIRVADAGPGVPVALRERIFDPYFGTKDKGEGVGRVGLGLFMVRQSVLSAGGRIHVESSPAGGAEFIVTIPPQSGM
jgi:signal transduction histidine kinase